jgi:5-methylcytosine-specific restriction endonuclease McrA
MKRCTKCGEFKPATRDYFGHTPSGNFRGACRDCVRLNVRKWEQVNACRETKKGNSAKRVHGYSMILSLLANQGYCCVYCSQTLTPETGQIDHITPTSRGGSDSADNLQMLCKQCNLEKHAKTHEEHLAWRQKVGLCSVTKCQVNQHT